MSSYVSLCFSLFFFFKQKTAYEMRISDWCSDVCSSDLAMLGQPHHVHIAFDHQNIAFAAYACASLPKPVQLVAFGKQIGFGRVQVFGLDLADNEAAEADNASTRITERKHEAFAKAGVRPNGFRIAHTAGLERPRAIGTRETRGHPTDGKG